MINAWKQFHAAGARIKAARQQVDAARQALKGVQIEVKVGERALFEVLDAQRELVNGEVALARARHDHVVSSYSLLAATGRLTASYLSLPVAYPDLDDAVRRKNSKPRYNKHRTERRSPAMAAKTLSQPLKPAPGQNQWHTSVSETAPVKPAQGKRATRTIRISSVKPAAKRGRGRGRRVHQAPNPLASLRTSLPAD